MGSRATFILDFALDQQTGSFPSSSASVPTASDKVVTQHFLFKTSEPSSFYLAWPASQGGWSAEAAPCDAHIPAFLGRLGRAPRPGLQASVGLSLAPQTRQVSSGPSPCALSAGAQGGTGRSRRPALSDHLPRPLQVLRPCPWWCQKRDLRTKPRERTAATPWAVIQELPSHPSPIALGVYLSFCSPPVSLSLFFSLGGWDFWSSERSPSSLALRRRRSSKGKAAGWPCPPAAPPAAPHPAARTRWRYRAQPLRFGNGGVGGWKGVRISPNGLRLGPLPPPAGPTRLPRQAAGRLPRPLLGSTRLCLQFSLALRAEIFHLLALYFSGGLFSPSPASRGAQIAGHLAVPRGP